jgi:hypothetical protein
MEATLSSETYVLTRPTRCRTPENGIRQEEFSLLAFALFGLA